MTDPEMISSKEILDKTGISRATLNNYIKMGILPKPIIKKGGLEMQGVKQIGFFSADALELISKVKKMKSEGKSMTQIAEKFQNPADDKDDKKVDEVATSPALPFPAETKQLRQPQMETVYKTPDRRRSDGRITVSMADLDIPAYFVNHNFEIDWINRKAETLIFNQKVSALMDIESRNLFRLLSNKEIQSRVKNWREIIVAHMTILKSMLDNTLASEVFQGISKKEKEILENLYTTLGDTRPENFYHLPLNCFTHDNGDASYRLHTTKFREGTFFVCIPTDKLRNDILNILSQRERVIHDILKHRMPSLVSLCVLVADLQDSVRISSGLLPLEYFELINDLWKTVSPTFETYGAIYGKHVGDGMLNYFIKKPGHNYLMEAVNCAIELREIMKDFSGRWRLRKGWDNNLFLNIGLNEGEEFFGTIQSAANIEFTALGDSINYAGRLSDFARNGEIWTTKNLISKLSCEERQQIRFGVQCREKKHTKFVQDSFARIGDVMSKDDPHYRHFSAIDALPITEIKEMRSHSGQREHTINT